MNYYYDKNPGRIKVIKLSRNFGQTYAIQAGLAQSEGNCVGIISADLQEPYEMFVDMYHEWLGGAKFVIGERVDREEGWFHQKISNIYWNLVKHYALPDFPKLGYDFCLLDRQLVNEITSINEKNTSIFVLIYWFGYKAKRLPIKRSLRQKGKSQWSFMKKAKFVIDTLFGFTYIPSRLITYSSMIIGAASIIYLTYLYFNWHTYRESPTGWMTLVGLIVFMGSLILFALGLISEYLIRILDEARKRPPYVIEELKK